MKFFLITMTVLVGLAAAAQLPDSATQGPNPQDIATPEPEYIDIDEPESGSSSGSSLPAASPPPQAAPPAAPAPVQSRNFSPIPPRPVQRPISIVGPSTNARLIAQSYASPQRQYQPLVQHQQPIVHHQQPIVHHQQIIHQQPIIQHHQPIVQHHQIAYQQPIVHHHVQQQLPGHLYSSESGYQYRRPVYLRRFYRHRY